MNPIIDPFFKGASIATLSMFISASGIIILFKFGIVFFLKYITILCVFFIIYYFISKILK